MASVHGAQMTSSPFRSSSAVVRMPANTSLSAFSTVHPLLRSSSIKLAAEGSTTTFRIFLPPASFSSSSAYSPSVFCRFSARES